MPREQEATDSLETCPHEDAATNLAIENARLRQQLIDAHSTIARLERALDDRPAWQRVLIGRNKTPR